MLPQQNASVVVKVQSLLLSMINLINYNLRIIVTEGHFIFCDNLFSCQWLKQLRSYFDHSRSAQPI